MVFSQSFYRANPLGISLISINTDIGMDIIDIWVDRPTAEMQEVTSTEEAVRGKRSVRCSSCLLIDDLVGE